MRTVKGALFSAARAASAFAVTYSLLAAALSVAPEASSALISRRTLAIGTREGPVTGEDGVLDAGRRSFGGIVAVRNRQPADRPGGNVDDVERPVLEVL